MFFSYQLSFVKREISFNEEWIKIFREEASWRKLLIKKILLLQNTGEKLMDKGAKTQILFNQLVRKLKTHKGANFIKFVILEIN